MESTFLCLLVLSILCCAALSLPTSSVQSVNSVDDVPTKVIIDRHATLSKDIEKVQVSGSVYFDRVLKRTTRNVIDGHHACADGYVWYKIKCVTNEQYKTLMEDDYEE